MALTINTNVMSLNAQRNLGKSQGSLANSMQRLSSGLRINSAKDDAAGLAISDRMTSQIRGLNQASRNANDGISLAQTAEGALQESTNILQRMRELAVQSANDTNSDSDRSSLNDEVTQLKAELDRIAQTSEFNGRKVIDGTLKDATFQVGSNAGTNQTIKFSISSALGKDLSQVGTNIAATNGTPVVGSSVSGKALVEGELLVNGKAVGATDTGSAVDIAAAINTANQDGDLTVANIATAVNVQAFDFSTVTLDQTDSVTATPTTAGQTGVTAVPEVQALDFSSTSVADNGTIDFTINGNTVTYTNDSGGALTGEALVDDILTDVGATVADIGDGTGIALAKDGTTATQLNITQATGDEAPIADITTSVKTVSAGAPDSVGAGYNAGTKEVQTQDLSTMVAAEGDTITWTFDDGEKAAYIVGSGEDVGGADATGLNGVQLTDTAGRVWDLSATAGSAVVLTAHAGYTDTGNVITSTVVTDTSNTGALVQATDGTSTHTTNGVAATGETNTIDLSGVTLADGETMEFSVDGETLSFTNSTGGDLAGTGGALSDAIIASLEDSSGTGNIADIGNSTGYHLATSGTDMVLTQLTYSEKDIADVSSTIFSSAAGVTGSETTEGVTGVTAQAAVQTLDFSDITVLAGADMTFTVDGQTLTFSNDADGAVDLTGDALATAVVSALQTDSGSPGVIADIGNGTSWTLSAPGSGADTLVLTQTAGDEAPVTDNVTAETNLRGTYSLDFDNGTTLDVAAAVSGSKVTAQDLVDAINDDSTLDTAGFSAAFNSKTGKVEISKEGGAAFSLGENIDADADGAEDTASGVNGGLTGVGLAAAPTMLQGQISLNSNADMSFSVDTTVTGHTGTALSDAGLEYHRQCNYDYRQDQCRYQGKRHISPLSPSMQPCPMSIPSVVVLVRCRIVLSQPLPT